MQAFSLHFTPIPATEIARALEERSESLDKHLGEDIYFNIDPEYLQAARMRLSGTALLHSEKVGDKPTVILRAPGRLNAFLEYLDMCDGDHMSTTIDGDLPVCVTVRDDDIVRAFNCREEFETGIFSISEELLQLKSAPWIGQRCQGLEDNWDNHTRIYPHFGHERGDWMNYVRSSFLRVAWEHPNLSLRGVDMTFGESSIPLRGGTSSSSAIVVLSFLALMIANKNILPAWDIRRICKLLGEAEWYVGTHGGANDQTTILRNVPNGILYNRHSQSEIDSTHLPCIKGVRLIVAHSLWEACKSLHANHVFNLRKGWMDLGDDLMKQIIGAITVHLDSGGSTDPGWISSLLQERFSFHLDSEPNILESNPKLWRTIASNYNKFGSLDESLLGISDAAILELIGLLPEEIPAEWAGRILGKDSHEMDRDYVLPHDNEGGYRPRAAAKFFHKENILGRILEVIFREANGRLTSGEITVDSPEYQVYQVKVGKILDELQHTLRNDFQVSNYQLDLLLDIAKDGPGYLGGKLTGAGCGGCVTIMVRKGFEHDFCEYLDRRYYSDENNFKVYRSAISSLDSELASSLMANLDAALHDKESLRRVVTFSAGACAVDVARCAAAVRQER
jgi:galactokinase